MKKLNLILLFLFAQTLMSFGHLMKKEFIQKFDFKN